MDYECISGAERNFEPWRSPSDDQTSLEHQDPVDALLAAEEEDVVDPLQLLEQKHYDAQRDVDVGNALDDIQANNSARELTSLAVYAPILRPVQRNMEELDEADEELAKLAFQTRKRALEDEVNSKQALGIAERFNTLCLKKSRKKKDFGAVLGLKKKCQ